MLRPKIYIQDVHASHIISLEIIKKCLQDVSSCTCTSKEKLKPDPDKTALSYPLSKKFWRTDDVTQDVRTDVGPSVCPHYRFRSISRKPMADFVPLGEAGVPFGVITFGLHLSAKIIIFNIFNIYLKNRAKVRFQRYDLKNFNSIKLKWPTLL